MASSCPPRLQQQRDRAPIHFGTSSPSAGSAAAAGSRTVPRSARRGGEVPSAGGAGAAAAPGSSPPPPRRPQRPPSPGFPGAGSSRERRTRHGAPCPGAKPGGAAPGALPAPGRGTGRNRCRLHKRQTCRRTGAGGNAACAARFSERFLSLGTHPRASLINPLQLRSPLTADFYIREGE